MPGRKSPGPSVKDKELYEELRDEGNSKQKSARIANAAAARGRSNVGRKGGKSGDYEDWSKSDLYERAKEVGVDGRSSMSKTELISALRNG
ncbi:Rho termination factor [Mumia zhuanghuii]|uniref:Rho termination factor n=1 Tax=Mumia zhuanghuii TaxID=2585211 RepID=A0A5C4MHE0_9ACTN|nr:Rho termination factor [Mumia zhuanghuii]TNC39062.1 Rho termination factor [Mumia zhuanghuii]TNC47104.1 Rho termination factor [Mumia zhuanghuii]